MVLVSCGPAPGPSVNVPTTPASPKEIGAWKGEGADETWGGGTRKVLRICSTFKTPKSVAATMKAGSKINLLKHTNTY